MGFLKKLAGFGYRFIPMGLLARNKFYILCLHGVAPKNFQGNKRHLKLSDFEELLVFLKPHVEFINLKETPDLSNLKRSKKPKVLITFDDGYQNNFDFAAPLLTKHSIPAVFFVLTKTYEDKTYVQYADVVDFVGLTQHQDLDFDGEVFKKVNQVYLNKNGENLNQYFKVNTSKREHWKKSLIDQFPIDKSEFYTQYIQLMNEKQWKILDQNELFTVSSHTHTHYNVDLLNPSDLQFELKHSKEILEKVLERKVNEIAFPDGAYNQKVKESSLAIGYQQLFAVNFRLQNDSIDETIFKRFSYSNSTNVGANIIRLLFTF